MTGWLDQLSAMIAGLAMTACGGAALWLCALPAARMRTLMPSRLALVAVVVTLGLWCGAVFVGGTDGAAAVVADTLRNLAFLAWLAATFGIAGRSAAQQSMRLVLVTLIVINVAAAGFGLASGFDLLFSDHPTPLARMARTLALVDMVTASGGLLLVEHLVRHRSAGLRMPVLVVAAGMAALWVYALNIHLLRWIAGTEATALILVEPLAVLAVLPCFVLVALDTTRARMQLSRTIAVRTIAVAALVAYLIVIALTGLMAKLLGGDYGAVAQSIFLALALGLGGLFLLMPRARAWLSVMAAKHFFEHRYDYRSEWMRFTATLEGQRDECEQPYDRIARALAELVGSPAARVMTPNAEGHYLTSGAWQCAAADDSGEIIAARDAHALHMSAHIVEIDAERDRAAGEHTGGPAFALPSWIIGDRRMWVLMPLLHGGRLVALAILHRPLVARALDWEDLDVLRISGRQAASHIAEMQSQAELSESRRFDEFNRRFAFIMHDVKNLASQLGLLAANAERHAENPEFRADMIETLKLSVARMNDLLHRLSAQGRHGAVQCVPIKAAPLLARLAADAGRRHPVSTGCDDGLELIADGDAVAQILGHLTANAIDASAPDSPILVAASADGNEVRIDVIDHGGGMSRDFIRTKLFKPFVSTKDNGFGLGAFEALQLARAMGGRLDVESREGEGTRFSLWLPRAVAAANRKERAA